MTILPASQNKRRALVRLAMIGLALALAALVTAERVSGASLQGVTVAVLIAFCVFATLEFTVFDDVAKQAHYIAWYWGSFVGLFALAAGHILLSLDSQAVVAAQDWIVGRLGGSGPYQAFIAGTVVTPLLMVVGFAIVRAIDWLRSR